MTTLSSFGVPLGREGRGGLVKPMEAYKFRVLPLNIGGENSQIFCQQVQSCKLDLSKKTLAIDVRQSVNQEGFDAVSSVISSCKSVVVDYLNGGEDVHFSLVVTVDSISHELTMDYGLSKTLMHRLVVTFSECKTIPGNMPEARPYPMINTGTDKFITPLDAINLIDTPVKKVEEPEVKTVKKRHVKQETDKG